MKSPEFFKTAVRGVLLSSLPLTASFTSCSNETPQRLPTVSSPTTMTENRPTLVQIIEKARAAGHGVVAITIISYGPDYNVDYLLERVDLGIDNRDESLDIQTMNLNATLDSNPKVNSLTGVFLASSCTGEYKLSQSIDKGKTWTVIPSADPQKQLHETFKLPESCVADLVLVGVNPVNPK